MDAVSEAPTPPSELEAAELDPRDSSPSPPSSTASSSQLSSRSDAEHDDAVSTSTTLYADSSAPLNPHKLAHHHPHAKHASEQLPEEDSAVAVVVQNPETITAETIERHLYTHGCPPLDLLVRTSGVTRLSDFMLWQCHEGTHISFLDCYWPEFDLWQFIPVLLEWQWRQKQKERGREERRRRGRGSGNGNGNGNGGGRGDKVHVD